MSSRLPEDANNKKAKPKQLFVLRQAQCSTLPIPNNASPAKQQGARNKIQLKPDHGPLNWIQQSQSISNKLKITLMKIISILFTVFTDEKAKEKFLEDNIYLQNQVSLLITLADELSKTETLNMTSIKNTNKKLSIFEKSEDENRFNAIFAKILNKVEPRKLLELFKNTNFKLDSDAIIHNYQLKNINICWMVLKSKVYYITPYLLYHPGGDSILLKTMSSKRNVVDKYKDFQKYHPWVNETDLLAPYLIGYV